MQIKAGFRKEILMFSRTFKLWGIIIAALLFAIADPIMFKLMYALQDVITQQYDLNPSDDTTTDDGTITVADNSFLKLSAPDETEKSSNSGNSFSLFLSDGDLTVGVYAATSDLTGTVLLILVLVLMSTAGGEQKKRSTIIPNCAGLTPLNYVLPKFLLYPAFSFAVTFIGVLASFGVSRIIFGGELAFTNVLASGAYAGGFMFFMTVIHLTLGICTGKAGMSAAVTYISATFVPLLMSVFHVEGFNPFELRFFALDAANGSDISQFDLTNVLITVAISVILVLVFFFLTLFVLNARKINNLSDEKVM